MVVIYKKTGGSYFLLINIYSADTEKKNQHLNVLNKLTTIPSNFGKIKNNNPAKKRKSEISQK